MKKLLLVSGLLLAGCGEQPIPKHTLTITTNQENSGVTVTNAAGAAVFSGAIPGFQKMLSLQEGTYTIDPFPFPPNYISANKSTIFLDHDTTVALTYTKIGGPQP